MSKKHFIKENLDYDWLESQLISLCEEANPNFNSSTFNGYINDIKSGVRDIYGNKV